MEQIVIFLFGLLAIVPTCLLAVRGRSPHRLDVHHWHHHEGPQPPQEPVQARYQVITGSSGAYVLDTLVGAKYAIVKPSYKDGAQ
jgi:hypothetical protein